MQPRLIRHGVVDSTNERALAALAAGEARDGDVHVAEEQSAGRGRLGRRWWSATGAGVFATLVARPGGPIDAAPLTLAAGLAVLEACRALGLGAARLDWPNDVVASRGKLAGVLVETRSSGARDVGYAVGVGLNVAAVEVPLELGDERRVTNLASEGVEASLADAEQALVAALRAGVPRAWEAPREVLASAFEALVQAGRDVVVDHAGERRRGRLEALDAERGLALVSGGRRAWLALPHVRSVRLADAPANP